MINSLSINQFDADYGVSAAKSLPLDSNKSTNSIFSEVSKQTPLNELEFINKNNLKSDNEIIVKKEYTKTSLLTSMCALNDRKDEVVGTAMLIKRNLPKTGFVLTPVIFKGREIYRGTENALMDLYSDICNLSDNEKDIDSKISLLNKKTEYISVEFQAKFAILDVLTNMSIQLLDLQEKGVYNESGLEEVVSGIINGISTSKPNYRNIKNEDELNKSFEGRIENMFGGAFKAEKKEGKYTFDKIDEKIEKMKEKQKVFAAKLKDAQSNQKTEDITKYTNLIEANQLGISLLLLIKTTMEETLNNILIPQKQNSN